MLRFEVELSATLLAISGQAQQVSRSWSALPQNTIRIALDTDAGRRFELPIESGLNLLLWPVQTAQGIHLGWTVSVERSGQRENLLEHERFNNGPFPTDLFAGSQRLKDYPDERRFGVYGLPYEVRTLFLEATIRQVGRYQTFTGGWLEVSWRRKP